MITCLLLFDATADAVSVAIGVGSILFLIMFFIIMWFDQRHDKQRRELSMRLDKVDRELRDQMHKDHSELRDRVSVTERELRTKISDIDRQLRDALAKLRADLTTVRTSEEREQMEALWASLLAESRERVERIKRKNQPPKPTTTDDLEQNQDSDHLKRAAQHLERSAEFLRMARGDDHTVPDDDIDEGLKRLERTIASMTPSDDAAMQRIDASLKRILENLKKAREIQKRDEENPS